MRKLRVEVKDRNKSINYKGRSVRSPVTFEIKENELKLLEGQLRLSGVSNYKIEESKPKAEEDTFDKVRLQTDEEIIIEDLCEEVDEPKTILERLIRDNNWTGEIKKMKRILIFQENVSVVEVFDADESDIHEYSEKLSNLLESSSVSVLKTTSSSAIVRPSKIVSILVYPVEDPSKEIQIIPQEKMEIKEKTKKSKPKAKVEHEDIITDADWR